eukprot:gene11412-7916_t
MQQRMLAKLEKNTVILHSMTPPHGKPLFNLTMEQLDTFAQRGEGGGGVISCTPLYDCYPLDRAKQTAKGVRSTIGDNREEADIRLSKRIVRFFPQLNSKTEGVGHAAHVQGSFGRSTRNYTAWDNLVHLYTTATHWIGQSRRRKEYVKRREDSRQHPNTLARFIEAIKTLPTVLRNALAPQSWDFTSESPLLFWRGDLGSQVDGTANMSYEHAL